MRRFGHSRLPLGLSLLIGVLGCDAPTVLSPGSLDCPTPVFYREQVNLDYVSIVGSFNDWDRASTELEDTNGDRDFFKLLYLKPGNYAYRLYVDGREVLDRTNPIETLDQNGDRASLLTVADCNIPKVSVTTAKNGPNAVTVFVDIVEKGGDPGSGVITLAHNQGIVAGPTKTSENPGRYIFEVSDLPPGKHTFQASADLGQNSIMSPLHTYWNEETEFHWEGSIIYQIMVDRFMGPQGESLSRRGARRYHGGHLDGIRATIESGYFDDLSIDAIWLSPLNDNPEGLFLGRDGEEAEAYHGYWHKSPREVENRFGDEAALDALIKSAHDRGLRVLLDVVPNHIHEEHPYVQNAPSSSWFNQPEGDCICGFTCSWGENMRECWFDPFLPDLNWWNDDVSEAMLSDIEYWYSRFSLDGLRVDAVPMMPRNAVRLIRQRLNQNISGERPFLLGETFTHENGFNQIRYYLGPESLSSQFDFTLMWGLRSFLNGHTSGVLFQDLLETGIEAWDIPQVHMAPIIGNHDVPRIATVMNSSQDEEINFDAAYDDISATAAAKTTLAWTMNAVQPGLPVLYYGDEWLTRGANDPYNRAPFPDTTLATPQQQEHYETVKRWNAFRRSSNALRFGTISALNASTHYIALERASEEETLYYVLSKGESPVMISLPCSSQPVLSQPIQADIVQLDPLTWSIPPMTAVLFEREDPLCAR